MGTTMWDSLKRGLQDGAAIVFDKAEGLTQVGRARLDVAAAKTRVARLEGELGVETFRLIESGGSVADSERVRALCDAIREARGEREQAERAFEQVKEDLKADDEPEAPLGT